jgi:hypothetical protein
MFKYLGTTLTDQNSIQEEIKSRLKLGNACYHSVQNLLSSWMDLQEVGWVGGDWMELVQDRDRWRALVDTVRNFRVP